MQVVGLIFGGIGNEREVSSLSAQNIIKNLDYKKYKLQLVYWHSNGNFYLQNKKIKLKELSRIIDVAFLVTHGKYGEDGYLQNKLEKVNIKYCGSNVSSSKLCMDKGKFKQFMTKHKILQVKYKILNKNSKIDLTQLKKKMELPVFVKPANSGSSIGISKVNEWSQFKKAVKLAFKHDDKVIVEQGLVNPREIEVAVLGNKKLIVSVPGELGLNNEFYSYNDKYVCSKTKYIIPAKIPEKINKKIKSLTKKIYSKCGCTGFARVDFFLHNNKIYINEINTLPGFTEISMYPMLMQKTGISYKQLITKIIELV